jgi:hypothetical protein
MLSLTLNGKEGIGILLRRKLDNLLTSPGAEFESRYMIPIPSSKERGLEYREIVSLDSDLALNVSLVGGKGASLARLERSRSQHIGTPEVDSRLSFSPKCYLLRKALWHIVIANQILIKDLIAVS